MLSPLLEAAAAGEVSQGPARANLETAELLMPEVLSNCDTRVWERYISSSGRSPLPLQVSKAGK